jgi:hypothetical protein
VFGSLTDELMTIFISQSSDALNPHQSVLDYHQSDSQISDKSDEPCFFFGIFEKLVLFLDNDIDINIQIDYPNPDP